VTVNWNGPAVLATVRAATVQGLHRGVEDVANEAVSLILNTPKSGRIYHRGGVAHQASAPGEPPASDTGQLVASVTTSVDETSLTGNVNFGSDHALALEKGTFKMAPRPFARPALVNKRDAVRQDIAEEIEKALR
jgi:HK97 gp10 family phage protein